MAFRRRDNETRQTRPNYEHYAGMDLDTMPEEISSDPSIRNAILLSKQALQRRSAGHEQPQERPSLRDRFDRIVRSRRSKYAGMALVASLAISTVLSHTSGGSDKFSVEAALQSSAPVPTVPEQATTTTLISTVPLESGAEVPAPESVVMDEGNLSANTEKRIIIRAGGTLWWEIDDIFKSAGLTDGDCIEFATRSIVNALGQTTGQDLNNLQPGPQDFGVTPQQIDNELLVVAAQDPNCSVIA